MNIFRNFHRDVYSVLLGILVLAGLITVMLVTLNPIR